METSVKASELEALSKEELIDKVEFLRRKEEITNQIFYCLIHSDDKACSIKEICDNVKNIKRHLNPTDDEIIMCLGRATEGGIAMWGLHDKEIGAAIWGWEENYDKFDELLKKWTTPASSPS